MINLRPRQHSFGKSRVTSSRSTRSITTPQRTMLYTVEKSDTLQSISIKLGVSVSRLKTMNNLITDNDIFARRHLSVPVGQCSSEAGSSDPPTAEVEESVEEKSPLQVIENVDKEVREVLVKETILRSEGLLSGNAEARLPLIDTTYDDLCLYDSTPRRRNPFSGADCGLKWYILLIVVLILLLIVPVTYIVREYETGEFNVHNYAETNSSVNYDNL